MLGNEVGVGGCSRNELIGADVIGGEHAGAALGVGHVFGCLTESRLRLGGVVLLHVEFGEAGARHHVLRVACDGGLHLIFSAPDVALLLQERGKDEVRGYVFAVERHGLAELVFALR